MEPSKTITTAEFRRNLSEVLGGAHFSGQITDITHHGKLYAAVISDGQANIIRAFRAMSEEQVESLISRLGKRAEMPVSDPSDPTITTFADQIRCISQTGRFATR